MVPTLAENQIVVARIKPFSVGDVVIAWVGGVEVIKRIKHYDVSADLVFLRGDNEADSTDSRHYGAVAAQVVSGVVVWPRNLQVPDM